MTECWRTCRFLFPQEDVNEGHARKKELCGQRHGSLKQQAPLQQDLQLRMAELIRGVFPIPQKPLSKNTFSPVHVVFLWLTWIFSQGKARWGAPHAKSSTCHLTVGNSVGCLASPRKEFMASGSYIWCLGPIAARALMRMLMPWGEKSLLTLVP